MEPKAEYPLISQRQQAALQLPPLDERRRYDVDIAALYLGVHKSYIYELVKRGELVLLKEGRRSFLSGAQIAARCRVAA